MIVANAQLFFWTPPKIQTKQTTQPKQEGSQSSKPSDLSWGQKSRDSGFWSHFQTHILQLHILLWSYLLHIFCLCPSLAQGWDFFDSLHGVQPGCAPRQPAGSALQRLQIHPPTVWMKVLGQPKNDYIGQDARLLKYYLFFLTSFSQKNIKHWITLCYIGHFYGKWLKP